MNWGFRKALRELTPRQSELAFFISQGISYELIGLHMGITENTVKTEVDTLRRRLGFSGSRLRLMLSIREAIA